MKTIPLEEALKLASKRPLHASKDTIHEKTGIAISQCFQRGTETPDPNVNAALLAHFYNHGPELVDALARLVNEAAEANRLQHAGIEVPPEVWSDLYQSEQAARSLLSKASTVQMP